MAMEKKAIIFDIQKYCIHDGPGIRTNIFFKGCPLSCKWCANPESQRRVPELFLNPSKCIGCGNCVKACPNQAFLPQSGRYFFDRSRCTSCGSCTETCYPKSRKLYGREYSLDEVIQTASSDIPFYEASGGGITFSGGEPALWPAFISEAAAHFKRINISTAIETCGFAPWANFEQFLPFLDLVLFDVKLWDDEKHKEYCGGSNETILSNLERIAKKVLTVVRMPVIPHVNDSPEEVGKIAEYTASLNIGEMHLLPYHDMARGKYDGLGREYLMPPGIKAPAGAQMERLAFLAEGYGIKARVGG